MYCHCLNTTEGPCSGRWMTRMSWESDGEPSWEPGNDVPRSSRHLHLSRLLVINGLLVKIHAITCNLLLNNCLFSPILLETCYFMARIYLFLRVPVCNITTSPRPSLTESGSCNRWTPDECFHIISCTLSYTDYIACILLTEVSSWYQVLNFLSCLNTMLMPVCNRYHVMRLRTIYRLKVKLSRIGSFKLSTR